MMLRCLCALYRPRKAARIASPVTCQRCEGELDYRLKQCPPSGEQTDSLRELGMSSTGLPIMIPSNRTG